MSAIDKNTPSADPERQVDLLVDGELSEPDRRNLLLQFEREPDGWRRCALAFLEAQCWRAELGQVVLPAVAEPVRNKTIETNSPGPNVRRQSLRQHAATLLSMAASFLLALVVGMGLRGNSLHSPVIATRDLIPGGHRDAATSPAAQSGIAGQMPQPAGGWEMVALTSYNSLNGQAAAFCVPAQRRDSLDQNLLESIPDFIPPDVRQAFEESGHRVIQQREIVPVPMKDGRRLVVPVDRIEIHYLGRPWL